MQINGREVKTVAVDFDGTLFTEEYPGIGAPIIPVINYVKYLKEQGVELILYTAREGQLLEDAITACKDYGIEFDAVTENLQWRVDKYGPCRKIGADLYIDDRSISPINLPEFIKFRIRSDDGLRKSYDTNPYFRNIVEIALQERVDFLPAISALSDRLYDLESKITLMKYSETVLKH